MEYSMFPTNNTVVSYTVSYNGLSIAASITAQCEQTCKALGEAKLNKKLKQLENEVRAACHEGLFEKAQRIFEDAKITIAALQEEAKQGEVDGVVTYSNCIKTAINAGQFEGVQKIRKFVEIALKNGGATKFDFLLKEDKDVIGSIEQKIWKEYRWITALNDPDSIFHGIPKELMLFIAKSLLDIT